MKKADFIIRLLLFLIFLTACGDNNVKVDGLLSPSGQGGAPIPGATVWGSNGQLVLPITEHANMNPQLISRQPNGKIVITQSGLHARPHVFRLNADGTLDTSFGTNGGILLSSELSTDMASIVTSNEAVYIAYAGNSSTGTHVRRLLPNGSIDTSFGEDGVATLVPTSTSYVRDMLRQPDGKIIVAGTDTDNGDNRYQATVARLNSDGSIDLNFADDGVVYYLDSSKPYSAMRVRLDDDGSIWSTFYSNTSTYGDIITTKILSDGTVDSTTGFASGTDGLSVQSIGYYRSTSHDVLPLSSGKVLVVGNVRICNVCGGSRFRAFAMRLNSDGTRDGDFGSSGLSAIDYNMNATFVAARELPGDEYLLYLTKDGSLFTTVMDSNGDIDTSYGDSGLIEHVVTDHTYKNFLLDEDDLFLMTTYNMGSPSYIHAIVSKLSWDGVVDTSWADGGSAAHLLGPGGGSVERMRALEGGKTLLMGSAFSSGDNLDYLARLNEDGSFDETFGDGGVQLGLFGGINDNGLNLEILSDGRIITSGTSDGDELALAVFLPDGTPDPTFGSGGAVSYSIPEVSAGWGEPSFFGVDDDGYAISVFITGWETLAFVRTRPDGTLDLSFGTDGVSDEIGIDGIDDFYPMYGVMQPDGKMIVNGYYNKSDPSFHTGLFFLRIDTDGSLDNTFGIDGSVLIDLGNDSYEGAQGLALGEDGKIYSLSEAYLPPSYDTSTFLTALNSDGTLDASFGDNGILDVALDDFYVDTNAWMNPSLKYDEGRLYAFGIDSDDNFLVGSWDATGQLDSSFGSNGMIVRPYDDYAFDTSWPYRRMTEFVIDSNGDFKISFSDTLRYGILHILRH